MLGIHPHRLTGGCKTESGVRRFRIQYGDVCYRIMGAMNDDAEMASYVRRERGWVMQGRRNGLRDSKRPAADRPGQRAKVGPVGLHTTAMRGNCQEKESATGMGTVATDIIDTSGRGGWGTG